MVEKASIILATSGFHFFIFRDKIFRILLIFVFLFQQLVLAMDEGGSEYAHTKLMDAELCVSLKEIDEVDADLIPLLEKSSPGPNARTPTYSTFSVEQTSQTQSSFANQELLKIETSRWRNVLRWANVDSFLQRLGYSLALRKNEFIRDNRSKKYSRPVILAGGSFPLVADRSCKKALFVDGFRQGAEFVIFRTIHTGITALAIYQLYNYLNREEPLICHDPLVSQEAGDVIDFWRASEGRVLLGLFHDILGSQSETFSYLKYLMLTPVIWGGIRGFLKVRNSFLSNQTVGRILRELKGVEPGFVRDTFRWLLPFHPIGRHLSDLMDGVLWNANISINNLEEVEDYLNILVNGHGGYTTINALSYFMSIAYSMNTRDAEVFSVATEQRTDSVVLLDVEEESLSDRINYRFKMKGRALSFLHSQASLRKAVQKKTFREKTQSTAASLYAKYLLWSLGASRSFPEFAGPALFKVGKLYVQAKFIQTIVDAFLNARKCPEQPGVSVAGVEPWASDLTQACFEASAEIFNIVPGQPTETLVGNLDQYYFQNCTIDLNLSGRGLSGEVIANITRALLDHNVTFNSINLSGNAVNTPQDFDAVFPSLKGVEKLILASNNIGINSQGIQRLADFLSKTTVLKYLDLSDNMIGVQSSNDTLALSAGISHLSHLTFLDLSTNQIGVFSSEGIVGIADAISKIMGLVSFDISDNFIGYTDSNGTAALGQAFSLLTQLTYLDLSTNIIEWTDSKGTISFSDGLSKATSLTYLNFFNNDIGRWDSNGTQALGHALSNLKHLVFLDVAYNDIGLTDSAGALVFAQALSPLTRLTSLHLSQNFIGSEVLQSLVQSLYGLKDLRDFQFLPNSVTNTDIEQINQALAHTQATPLPSIIASPGDAEAFCQILPPSVQSCDLSGRMPSPTLPVVQALFGCLKNKQQVRSLDLSNNLLGLGGAAFVGQELWNFPELTFLNLSWNVMGVADVGDIMPLGEGLSSLSQLSSLDISHNDIGSKSSRGVAAFGQGVSNITTLTYFDLSWNVIDRADSDGTVVFSQCLSRLTQLIYLDLSRNVIGYSNSDGVIALGGAISSLSRLTFLDMSHNLMGKTDSQGFLVLFRSLANLQRLSFLNLPGNRIDHTDDLASIELGKSLAFLSQLQYLDLSSNSIGIWGSDGEISIARGLNQTKNLEFLNLGMNKIGSTDPEGPQELIPVLLSLPKLKFESLNVQGMTNISWTQAASYLQNRQSQAMVTACQASRCFGGDIHVIPSSPQVLEAPSYTLAQNTTVASESRALVVYDETISASAEPDMLSTLGMSALYGAAFAALPEALGDVLHLSGVVSERNAYHVKMAANAGLVFATGSWLPVGASLATTAVLQRLGISESRARLAGNMAAFLVNAGRAFTPAGVVGGATNYAAARFGLWVEKNLVKRFSPNN